jgi:hypothetical protein
MREKRCGFVRRSISVGFICVFVVSILGPIFRLGLGGVSGNTFKTLSEHEGYLNHVNVGLKE